MQCLKCQKEIPPNVKFCPECGTKMEKNAVCINCGENITPESNFCSVCGTPTGNTPTPGPKQKNTSPDGLP